MLSPRWLTLSAFWFSGGPAYPDSITRRRPALFPITHRTRFETHDRPRANREIQPAHLAMHALPAPLPPCAPRAASRVCAPWPLRRPAAAAPRAPRATHLCARRGSRHTPRGAKSVPRPTRHDSRQRTGTRETTQSGHTHTQTPCAHVAMSHVARTGEFAPHAPRSTPALFRRSWFGTRGSGLTAAAAPQLLPPGRPPCRMGRAARVAGRAPLHPRGRALPQRSRLDRHGQGRPAIR